MLIISNDDTARVLTMTDTIRVLEQAYAELATGEAVCRPRIDIHIPTSDPQKTYQWGTMEGGSRSGYFAIRMKSDVIYEQSYGGTVTQEKYCVEPGTYCGLVLLIRVETGEPLALLNDGWLQHFRVGADSAIGTRHMARKDSGVVGMLGSGGMARSHIAALREVMDIKEIKVYSPTEENRIGFAAEMTETYGIETTPVASAQAAHEGADILMGCTDATGPVIFGEWLEPGTHITAIGGRLTKPPGTRWISRCGLARRRRRRGSTVNGMPTNGSPTMPRRLTERRNRQCANADTGREGKRSTARPF